MSNRASVLAMVSVVLLCVTMLASTYMISSGNFYIKNVGTSSLQNDKILNTISVSGDGKVFARPDMVNMTLSVSESAPTSAEALEKANTKIKSVMDILIAKGIDKNDIQTSGLNIYTEYDYSGSRRKVVEQKADISLSIKIKGIDEKATKATQIIDEVSKVDKVEVGSISFDIENKKEFYTLAREAAFNKAKQKAEELAKLGGLKLLKPVSIADSAVDYSFVPYRQSNVMMKEASAYSVGGSTEIATGQLEVSISLDVIFGTE